MTEAPKTANMVSMVQLTEGRQHRSANLAEEEQCYSAATYGTQRQQIPTAASRQRPLHAKPFHKDWHVSHSALTAAIPKG